MSQPSVVLHQAQRTWGMPSASPFATKAEFFLRAAKVPHTVAGFNPMQAPRGKMPYINLKGNFVPDSEGIYKIVSREFGVDFESHLSAGQKALSQVVRRTLEDGTYFIVYWNRWGVDANWKKVKTDYFGSMPPGVRTVVPEILRKKVIKMCKGHGVARYSMDELTATMSADVNAVVDLMDDKGPYFFGEKLSKVDFTVYAFLLSLLKGQEPEPMKLVLNDKAKIERYVKGIEATYFADLAAAR